MIEGPVGLVVGACFLFPWNAARAGLSASKSPVGLLVEVDVGRGEGTPVDTNIGAAVGSGVRSIKLPLP